MLQPRSCRHKEHYHAVAGLVMDQLGRVPEAGDEVSLEGYRTVAEAMNGQRVATGRVSKR